jgi:hypothetical protein
VTAHDTWLLNTTAVLDLPAVAGPLAQAYELSDEFLVDLADWLTDTRAGRQHVTDDDVTDTGELRWHAKHGQPPARHIVAFRDSLTYDRRVAAFAEGYDPREW